MSEVARTQAGEGRAKPHIEILCVARLGIEHHGVSAHDEVLNFVAVENFQQFFEV
ncbi:MAG: hypothetical protein ACLP59_00255 [Bryobacteraceae bacterium]